MIEKALYVTAMILVVLVFLFAENLTRLRIRILRRMHWDRMADLAERYSKIRVIVTRVAMVVLFIVLGWLLVNP
jgi:membrane protein required for beta-lactamase induction